MAIKSITPEQQAKLKEHPYVQEVTEQFVYFSIEFKQRFFNEFRSMKKPRKIIIGMGLDPELLGQIRINGIKQYIMRCAKREKSITDILTSPEIYLPLRQTPQEIIRRFEHQLAYTRQEQEFVKINIASANRKA